MRFIHGDIFQSNAGTLVNPVNCVGVMGAGLALAFKRRYPAMVEEYRSLCLCGQLQPGKPHIYHAADGKTILNFPTKTHWWEPSRIEYIEAGLMWFRAHYANYGITSAAFPALGCGLGGLVWEEVQPIMRQYLDDLPIDIEVYVKV